MKQLLSRLWTSSPIRSLFFALLFSGLLLGCGASQPSESVDSTTSEGDASAPNPLRNAYFGDLHVHTKHSFDAYIFSVRATPDDAYRYARGEAIQHSEGFSFSLQGPPLDFQAVTDHASFLGLFPAMDDPSQEVYNTKVAREIREAGPTSGFRRALRAIFDNEITPLDDPEITKDAWLDIKASAERHYEPGVFTTFIGYEYTSPGEDRENLHRNVIFRGPAPDAVFRSVDSRNPEDLWAWLDEQRAAGIEALAIPHNSNGSGGQMFKLATYVDEPLTAEYADLRMRNEPIVEVTQVKGTSETHPMLSPNDEWADFEIMPYKVSTEVLSQPSGSYVREAYRRGLELQEEQGFNPFRFGLIGSTDSHNAGGTPSESNYHSKTGLRDSTPQKRGSVPLEDGTYSAAASSYKTWGASGLAGIWAEENTRESLYDAMRRKETFATTGPRIRVRFFAGYDYSAELSDSPTMVADAYAGGVSMGGDLLARGDSEPQFLVWATRDPLSAPLQRLQVVKSWVENGTGAEKVYDVACSGGDAVDRAGRCPDNGATVNLSDCSYSPDQGAQELKTLWRDPDFVAGQRSVYYVRVLENPTCRWSTWDAVRAEVAPNPELATTIQERAYSSPIWYVPE